MFTAVEKLAVNLAMALLQHFVTNPASVKQEGTIIHQIALLATQADSQVNAGFTWSYGSSPVPSTKTGK
jgi:hypothetical protein